MKKIITLLILNLSVASGLWAGPTEHLTVTGLSVEKTDSSAQVSFTASIGPRAAERGWVVVYAPVITDGEYRVSLPVIAVEGKGSRRVWDRREWIAGETVRYEDGFYATNGDTVNYAAGVPFQSWMHGARIEVEILTAGCCDTYTEHATLAARFLPEPETGTAVPELKTVEVSKPPIAEFLAHAFPFVLPDSEFDPDQPIRFYDDERDNALTIYYRINRYDIEPGYSGNEQTLTNLTGAIELIRQSKESEVARIVVAGFASPEGPFAVNDRLAWERAVSVKEYVMRHSGMADESILLFNGSADWRGLRFLVEKDDRVPGQQEVLDIIDSRPVWDPQQQSGRISMIRNLRGGETYRYMAEHLFPKLRNGAFIRVYYRNK